jgi:hypothetical protein
MWSYAGYRNGGRVGKENVKVSQATENRISRDHAWMPTRDSKRVALQHFAYVYSSGVKQLRTSLKMIGKWLGLLLHVKLLPGNPPAGGEAPPELIT